MLYSASVNIDEKLLINEIFFSIQGESLFVGKPTVFVRTAGCNLRCVWCDTKYAFWEGHSQSLEEIVKKIQSFPTKYVCLTGGEPLGQRAVYPLMNQLVGLGFIVSLETGGGFSVSKVPSSIVKILDIKCPDSHESKSMVWENLDLLNPQDQVKFVIASRKDFDWAIDICDQHHLFSKCTILISAVFNKVPLPEVAQWILESAKPFTLQTQLHKHIWGESQRGV